MEGIILDYNRETEKGLILGDNKERYAFTKAQWKSEKLPKVQMKVNFVVDSGEATDIYSLSNAGIDMPNVDMNSIKEKFSAVRSGVQESVLNNASFKQIIENGVFNKVSLALLVIAFFGLFTDVVSIGYLGFLMETPSSSLSAVSMGWLLVLVYLLLMVATALGVRKKIVLQVGIASIVLFAWQFYALITEVRTMAAGLRLLGGRGDEIINTGATLFIVLSFLLLLVATFLPKKESPVFIQES